MNRPRLIERKFRPGDVFQINANHKHTGWVGLFMVASEVRPWGIVGYISRAETHHQQRRIFIRLEWMDIEYMAPAAFIPDDLELYPEILCGIT